MSATYAEQLALVLVQREGAIPETAAVLARLVVDGASAGSISIPEAISSARVGYPNLFAVKTPALTTAPEAETVTARVARLHREAESRGEDPASHMPVTMRVLREARDGE